MKQSVPPRRGLISLIRRLFGALFGRLSWEPAPWQARFGGHLRRRRRWWLGGLGLALMLGTGWYWWINRPVVIDPEALSVRVLAPDPTNYRDLPLQFDSLELRFSGSAAPIERIDQAALGVSLSPAAEGQWLWVDDHRIRFSPSADWPVGQAYQISIDPLVALAPGIKLREQELNFTTAKFSARISQAEYYQDPQDPSVKRGTYELSFSHPIEVASFERALSLSMADGAGTAQPAPRLSVSYDEQRLRAYVQSEPLKVPENGGSIALKVAAGIHSSIDGPGLDEALDASISLPSLYSVAVDRLNAQVVDNERFEPEQLLLLNFNDRLKDDEVTKATRAWLLPATNPEDQNKRNPYPWSLQQVDQALLNDAEAVELSALPTERAFTENHQFRYLAPPGRRILVEVDRGLRSFGGYLLGQPYRRVLTVPDYPQLLRFVGEGALLSLKGERRISVAARNVPGLSVEIGRVKPDQLQRLVMGNHGRYQTPQFYDINTDDLVERFHHRVELANDDPRKTEYQGVDLGEYFSNDRHGVFLLRLYPHDPAEWEPGDDDERSPMDSYNGEGWDGATDSRLVVLTDLGLIAKQELGGGRAVFVMSIANGTPIAGAQLRVWARNGDTLMNLRSDADGRVNLPDLSGFKREKQAVMITAESAGDLSFLPLNAYGRDLEFSRFDIGGEINASDPGALKAYLFSDRGLYRPGDTLHIGLIVRASDWSRPLLGIPLEYQLRDPVGNLAQRQLLNLGREGFEAVSYTPSFSAPTGNWEASVYLIGENEQRTLLGSTSVQVRDFLPDRLKSRAQFLNDPGEGWLSPDQLRAKVNVENLFGTPAQDRRVSASLLLQPAFPAFSGYSDFQFYDPLRAKEGYQEPLEDLRTGADGQVEFPVDLSQFASATYQLRLLTQSFEAGGGRGVSAQASVLVSSNPYLIGIKAVDSLGYVKRGSSRSVELIAIGPDAKPLEVDQLSAVLIEKRYVSVLTKQDSGLYKYVSQLRSDERSRQPLKLPATAHGLTLDTATPGDFVLQIVDASDTVLNSISYSVAGSANLTRSLDRNAELGITLSQADYSPGSEIEVAFRAPYTGAGLITIERDRVYAHQWFKADTTSSIQHITLPADFEGNGYINVQFIRDPGSDEVYMSPLSYAIAPFTADRSARQLNLRLQSPTTVRPGEAAEFTLRSSAPARAAVFAIDEGILQVARYRLGDPLDHFFTKKMLQVSSAQILDLILPEFSKLAGLSAPGGDADGLLAKNLNPFKRKGDKPAVYWSGLVQLDGEQTFRYTVPDSFNGKLRVMAVAVSPAQVGIAQSETLVRGDFVLSPNAPLQVAPGDEFEVSVGVANTVSGAPKEPMQIDVGLDLGAGLTIVGDSKQSLALAPGDESIARFRVRAGAELGAPTLVFRASHQQYHAQRQIDLSLRPGLVYRTDIRVGYSDEATEIGPLRQMHVPLAKRQVAASAVPLVLANGLAAYLGDYPHRCTEQILSQGIPALVFAEHPEFGSVSQGDPEAGIFGALRERINGSGAIGTWRANLDTDPFLSAYALLYLLEAGERGREVPDDLVAALNRYLQQIAKDASMTSVSQYRARALAIYLLTRQGRTTTNLLGTLQEQLDRDMPLANGPGYREDATAVFLAASYQLLKQSKPARQLLQGPIQRIRRETRADQWLVYQHYYDEAIASAWTVYLVAHHFPDQREQLGNAALRRLVEPLTNNRYNTLSSALTVLALEAWGTVGIEAAPPQLLGRGAQANSAETALGQVQGLLRSGSFDAQIQKIRLVPAEDVTAWFSLSQAGYDLQPPPATQYRGLELIRDYLDENGKVIDQITVGDELQVRLRLRALDADAVADVAIVDLLPGGFEVVMGQADPDGDNRGEAPTLAQSGTTMAVQHEEVREDRVVLYARAGRSVSEYHYRIKATAVGEFTVAPAYAESMYRREVYAQGGPAEPLKVVSADGDDGAAP